MSPLPPSSSPMKMLFLALAAGTLTLISPLGLASPEHTKNLGSATPPPADLFHLEDKFFELMTQNLLPAFGKLENMLLTSKPSFSIRITPEGVEIQECSFQFQIKQMNTIEHPLPPPSTDYDMQAPAQTGDPITLLFEVQCGLEHFGSSLTFFEVSMSVLGPDKKPTYYGLKVHSLERGQMNIKLWGMKTKLHIDSTKKNLLMGPKGLTRPFTEEFAKTHPPGKEGLYEVKASLWPPFRSSPPEESTVLIKKISVSHTMEIDGSAELSFPVSVEGVKQDTLFRFPFKGQIFFSEEGDVIPVIDFSIQ